MRINVTKSFLPPQEEYQNYISKIWKSSWLTNNGPLLVELEQKLKEYLDISNFLYVNNGTIAIQLAIKALELTGEIITTPFSYCATTTSVLWENLKPVFVDINPHDFNINADLIEEKITAKTSAILATHVYGFPCETEKIEAIAQKYNLKIIYDAAHAFGVKFKGKSLLNFGDVSTCSFHSTKVFHTIEGGSVACKDVDLYEKIKLTRSFGHVLDDYYLAGINGKNSEFHAAMGLCNIKYVPKIISDRKNIFDIYTNGLDWTKLSRPASKLQNIEPNYAYYPILLNTEEDLKKVVSALNLQDIYPRRYFYPSLNKLPYIIDGEPCPISESISVRVLSLPLYPDLEHNIVHQILSIINQAL